MVQYEEDTLLVGKMGTDEDTIHHIRHYVKGRRCIKINLQKTHIITYVARLSTVSYAKVLSQMISRQRLLISPHPPPFFNVVIYKPTVLYSAINQKIVQDVYFKPHIYLLLILFDLNRNVKFVHEFLYILMLDSS